MVDRENPVVIYHNPRCSKSRQTLQLLTEQGIQPKIVEYLKQTPSKPQLKELLAKLSMGPLDIMRKNEPEYKEFVRGNEHLDDDALLQILIDHPRLIERPIVTAKQKAKIGRPPEGVLEIL